MKKIIKAVCSALLLSQCLWFRSSLRNKMVPETFSVKTLNNKFQNRCGTEGPTELARIFLVVQCILFVHGLLCAVAGLLHTHTDCRV